MDQEDWVYTQHLGERMDIQSLGKTQKLTRRIHSLLQAGVSKVFITSRKAAACQEACEALNDLPCAGKAISIPADLAKAGEVERLVAEVEKHTDHVDILLANAGATWGAPFDEHPENAFGKVMDLNVKSVFVCVQKYVDAQPWCTGRSIT